MGKGVKFLKHYLTPISTSNIPVNSVFVANCWFIKRSPYWRVHFNKRMFIKVFYCLFTDRDSLSRGALSVAGTLCLLPNSSPYFPAPTQSISCLWQWSCCKSSIEGVICWTFPSALTNLASVWKKFKNEQTTNNHNYTIYIPLSTANIPVNSAFWFIKQTPSWRVHFNTHMFVKVFYFLFTDTDSLSRSALSVAETLWQLPSSNVFGFMRLWRSGGKGLLT